MTICTCATNDPFYQHKQHVLAQYFHANCNKVEFVYIFIKQNNTSIKYTAEL